MKMTQGQIVHDLVEHMNHAQITDRIQLISREIIFLVAIMNIVIPAVVESNALHQLQLHPKYVVNYMNSSPFLLISNTLFLFLLKSRQGTAVIESLALHQPQLHLRYIEITTLYIPIHLYLIKYLITFLIEYATEAIPIS